MTKAAVSASHAPIVRGLLSCGIVSSALYVVIDVVGAVTYPGYNYAAQAISEMSAIGAPTAQLLAPFYRLWSLLFLAFTAGVWIAGGRDRVLRWSAAFMVAVAIVGAGFAVFPMNERSSEPTFSDTMHLAVAAITILLLSGTILTGGLAFESAFRRYSSLTVAVMFGFFDLTMRDVPNVAADLPTPFMGLKERVSMAAWLLWLAVFSGKLLQRDDEPIARAH